MGLSASPELLRRLRASWEKAWHGPERFLPAPPPADLPAPDDLTSLDERLGLLFLVRLGMVAVVVLGALFTSRQVGFGIVEVGPVTAAYVVVAAAAEAYRRARGRGRMRLHRGVLPLDAVYLAIVTTPSGGPRSPLVVLFAVQLISVTLLASERVGIRMALWDSFVFIIIPTLSLSGHVGTLLGVREVAVPSGPETALAIMGFWVVAICTAAFSSVSERELRRSKLELTALADMASRLESMQSEEEILTILLGTVIEAFPFQRGALWWAQGERPSALIAERGGEVERVPLELRERPDSVASFVWSSRQPLLLRSLDPAGDPLAASLLPGARNVVALPLRLDGGPSGVVLLEHGGHPLAARLPKGTVVMLLQFATHAALALRNARLLSERERLAALDGLTGLANRREFDQVLAREVSRSSRSREPLSLVVLDVDHFKSINDTRGHLAGDEVLRSIAVVLKASVRDMDLAARYGGEEFALVLPCCSQADALVVVRRVQAAIRGHRCLDGITVSFGVAAIPTNASDVLGLIAAADAALYESKRAGRDRYTLSERQPNGSMVMG